MALASAIDLANTYSAVYTAVVSFFDASIPRNSGTYRPTSIVAPEGSLVNPRALFVNATHKRAKILLGDGTGLCIYTKRLERGRFACL